MIRITGGKDKGRYIRSPISSLDIRPLPATLRRILFDTLGCRIQGALFLDVFAGVGTVGIEALSRGAKEVVFIEKNKTAIRLIEENLKLLNYTQKAQIICGDAFKVYESINKKFDIIFLGPPYGVKGLTELPQIYEKLLRENGIIIIQHFHKVIIDPLQNFDIKAKRQGENVLTFFFRGG